jgi:hypothetical protein
MSEKHSPSLQAMIAGDRIDARAMIAAEVHKEREYRLKGGLCARLSTPGSRVTQFGDTGLREEVERQNSEPLL